MIKGSQTRTADHAVEPLFVDRWSPRAMSGEAIEPAQLMRLFEAARWAPSAMNAQPWRLLYARRDTEQWPLFFDLLVPANQLWVAQAAALVLIVSDKAQGTHSFDTGAAWQNLALQGMAQGLVVHGMAGFDYAAAATRLQIPEGFKVEAMVAIGKPGQLSALPEKLQSRESPSPRRPLSETICEGVFTFQ